MEDRAQNSADGGPEIASATRSATILLLLAFVLAIATVSLNRSLLENRREFRLRSEWYEETGSMLARARALHSRSPALFEGLALASLANVPHLREADERYPKLASLFAYQQPHFVWSPDDGLISRRFPYYENQYLSGLMRSANDFGIAAARILAHEADPAKRPLLLEKAVDQAFTDAEARQYLLATVVDSLSRVDQADAWPMHVKASWIVYGEWPLTGGVTNVPPPLISYRDRFFGQSDPEGEKSFLYRVIGPMEMDEIEKSLDATWRKAYDRLRATPAGDPLITIPGVGLVSRHV